MNYVATINKERINEIQIQDAGKIRRMTEDEALKAVSILNSSSVVGEAESRIRLLEATLRLIAEPERQNDYTPQQLARHALRIEPLPKLSPNTEKG